MAKPKRDFPRAMVPLRLERELVERIRAFADKNGISFNAAAAQLLEEALIDA